MTKTKVVAGDLAVRALSPETWDAFADLAERHNGVWGVFEQAGFTYSRPKGKNHCVMSTTVSPVGVSR